MCVGYAVIVLEGRNGMTAVPTAGRCGMIGAVLFFSTVCSEVVDVRPKNNMEYYEKRQTSINIPFFRSGNIKGDCMKEILKCGE